MYWLFRDDMAVNDGIIMKDRYVIIPDTRHITTQALDQLLINCMGTEKTKLLANVSIYWGNINDDIENYIKNCATCLTFQQT